MRKKGFRFTCISVIVSLIIALFPIPCFAEVSPSNVNTNDKNTYLDKTVSTTGIPGAPPDWSPKSYPKTLMKSSLLKASTYNVASSTFHTTVYTFRDIVVFSYFDNTTITIQNSSGETVYNGVLDANQHYYFSGSSGVYQVSSTKSFTVLVGDALSSTVQGYFAVDQSGRGKSTLLNTYMVGKVFGTERFIVFAYEDGTEFTIKNLDNGTILYAGSLNEGEHFTMPETPYRMFLQVSANKPVSALSYGDQDYYVPSSNGTFNGNIFYGYSGYIGNWTNSITVTAYQPDTQVTVTNTVTGEVISQYTLGMGQVHTDPITSEVYWKVEASKPVTAADIPFAGYEGNYYYMTRAIDQTGSGSGKLFYVPTIGSQINIFSFADNNQVTITQLGTKDEYPYPNAKVIYNGQLNSGQDYKFDSQYGQYVYKVEASENVSVLQSNGGAGADFMPLSFAQELTDLGISSSDIQFSSEIKNCKPGDIVTANVTIHNYSTIPASKITVNAYDGDPDGGGTAPVIATRSIEMLAGGNSADISFQFSVPNNPEYRNIIVKVDPEDLVVESNNSNNKAVKPLIPNKDLLPPLSVNITAPAGLIVSNNLLDPNPFTVSADIFNSATVNATDVKVELKLLDGLSLSAGDLITNITDLPPSKVLHLSWQISADQAVSGINRYQLKVSASNAESKDVNRAINVPDMNPPANPGNLTATTINNGNIKLIWSANTEKDLAGYKIYYGTDSLFNGTDADQGPSPIIISTFNEYTLTGLNPDTTYYIAVKSFDMSGNESGYSNIVSQVPEETHTITVDVVTGGSITANPVTATSGSSINLTITPEVGKRLKQGSLKYNDGKQDVAITGTSFIMPEADVKVTAEFEDLPVNFYNIKVGVVTGGSITVNPATAASGSSINLAIIPEKGKRLKQGSLKYNDGKQDVAIIGTSFIMPEADVTVTAEFEKIPETIKSHTVTFVDWNGTILKTEVVNDGAAASAPSNPSRAGYLFKGWDVSYNNITRDLTVTAQYRIDESASVGSNSADGNNILLPKIKGSELKGWPSIITKLKEYSTGSLIIDMNGSTIVKKDVLEAIRGKNLEVKFSLPNGIEWIINGKDIPENTELKNIDLGLSFNTENIPAELIDGLSGTDKIMFALAHNGSFGFMTTLRIPLNKGNKGQKAYLFYYNPITRQLELQTSSFVDEDGYVEFNLPHASDYVILIHDESLLKDEINNITVTPAKKILYYGGTKDKSITMKTILQKSLQEAVDSGIYENSVTYLSSNPKVASVSKTGKVVAKKAGKTIITTLITLNGIERKFQTTITVKKAFIKMTMSTSSMKTGESYTFEAIGYGVASKDISYLTTKKAIVSISKTSGKAKAVSTGTDYVIAKAGDIEVKIKVTVK